jgi:osomolarity two-component system, phosphorelay intermediate protein YPD1
VAVLDQGTLLTLICSEGSDLPKLSQLGHFLKGSSATLGMTKVKDSCEKIQHFGARKDASGTENQPDDAQSLKNVEQTIGQAKSEFEEAERVLKRFYHDED